MNLSNSTRLSEIVISPVRYPSQKRFMAELVNSEFMSSLEVELGKQNITPLYYGLKNNLSFGQNSRLYMNLFHDVVNIPFKTEFHLFGKMYVLQLPDSFNMVVNFYFPGGSGISSDLADDFSFKNDLGRSYHFVNYEVKPDPAFFGGSSYYYEYFHSADYYIDGAATKDIISFGELIKTYIQFRKINDAKLLKLNKTLNLVSTEGINSIPSDSF